ncbi:MAG: hypothetical protein JXA25_06475 [Anaerolineales bacterium]|nr:hypothetical protein [Anaerolineales bacterium]
MPQLEKGGKHVFGWSRIGTDGRIRIPPEAAIEYSLESDQEALLLNGSRTSGGFGLGRVNILLESTLGQIFRGKMDTLLGEPFGTAIQIGRRVVCRVQLRSGEFVVPVNTLERFGAAAEGKLLVLRGSGMALGFSVRGPIFKLAEAHPELLVF